MTTKTITADDRLRLVGLLAYAAHHRRALEDIENSAYALLGMAAWGQTRGAVWFGNHTADALLDAHDITVVQPSTTPEEAGEQMRKAVEISERIRARDADAEESREIHERIRLRGYEG